MVQKSFLIICSLLISGNIPAYSMSHDSSDKDGFQQKIQVRLSTQFGVRKSSIMINRGNSYTYSEANKNIFNLEHVTCGMLLGNADAIFAMGRLAELGATKQLPESYSEEEVKKLGEQNLSTAIEFYEQAANKGSALACEALYRIYSGFEYPKLLDLEKTSQYSRQYLVSTSKSMPQEPTFLKIEKAIKTDQKIASLTGTEPKVKENLLSPRQQKKLILSPCKQTITTPTNSQQRLIPQSSSVSILKEIKNKVFCCFGNQ